MNYAWTGRLQVDVYPGGGSGAIVTIDGSSDPVVTKAFSGFVYPMESPPVKACARRPSWIAHGLHWDTFGCAHTLTGPLSLSAPGR